MPSRNTIDVPRMAATMVQRSNGLHRSAECCRAGWERPLASAARGVRREFGRGRMLRAVPGPVALVGAGEFLAPMAEFDRGLLEATGRSRPRVAILPTASALDGEETFLAWAEMGVQHFSALGAEVEPVLVRTAADGHDGAALQAIGEADLDLPLGRASRGTCSTCCAARRWGRPSRRRTLAARSSRAARPGRWRSSGGRWTSGSCPKLKFPLPFPIRWPEGLSLVNGVAVLPHYDAWPEPLTALVALQAPRSAVIVGIDEDTAVVGRSGAWQVHGRGPRHRLARPPPRALPQGRGVPDLRPRRQMLTGRALDAIGRRLGGRSRRPVHARGEVDGSQTLTRGALAGSVRSRAPDNAHRVSV